MKNFIFAIPAFALCLCACLAAAPAFAADYVFESGARTLADFGGATSVDGPVTPDPMSANVRRNKDAAYLPPPYFYGSGDIPTEPSSPYHDNLRASGFVSGAQNPPASGGGDYAPGSGSVTRVLLPAVSATSAMNTEPLYYGDGSIGTLYIPKLDKTIKVFEGESLENMKKGIGHFAGTSAWDGNCALAGHNRGAAAYFAFVKDLAIGDKLTYTTPRGTRTYEIHRKEKISETDFSGLARSSENILSLITCVENEAAYRWLVQAGQI
jgi:sortase A